MNLKFIKTINQIRIIDIYTETLKLNDKISIHIIRK